MKIKILLLAFAAMFLCSCDTKQSQPQNIPQVVAAKITTSDPLSITQKMGLSSFQRGLLTEADSTLPIVVQVVFAPPVAGESVWLWLTRNWWAFLLLGLGIWEIFARRTPTEVDNTILAVIQRILDYLIPNKKIGGGTFAT